MISNRSIRIILTAKVSDWVKEAIGKQFRVILSFPDHNDRQPMDLYRYLGQQTLRLQLIHELNRFINEQTSNYYSINTWYKELWELRVNCEKLVTLTNQMIRGLIQQGNQTGIYDESKEVAHELL
jgi:hypothetical protein